MKPTEKIHETSGSENELEGINFGPRHETKGQEPGEFTKQFFVGPSEPRPAAARPGASSPVEAAPVAPVRSEVVPAERRNDQIAAADRTSGAGQSTSPHGGSPEFGGFTALFSPGPKVEAAEIKNASEQK